jgi:hypothetical protein
MGTVTWRGRAASNLARGATGYDLTLSEDLTADDIIAGDDVTVTDDLFVTSDANVTGDAIVGSGVTVGSAEVPLNGQVKFGVAAGSGYLTAYAAGAYIPAHLDGSETFFDVSGVEKLKLETTGNLRFKAAATLAQISTPSAPAAGYVHEYAKTDARLYQMTPAGVEDQIAITREQLRGRSLAMNMGPSIWQRGTSFVAMATSARGPDCWMFTKGGTSTLTLTQETSTIPISGKFAMKLVYVQNAASYIQQKIEDYLPLRSRTVTFTAKVSVATASAVRLGIYDSVAGWTYGSYHAGSGGFATISHSITVAAAATEVQIGIYLGASCTAYVGNMTFTEGAALPDYVPIPLVDDLAQCQRYYQVIGAINNQQQAVGQATSTTQAIIPVALLVEMGGSPTCSYSALADWPVLVANGLANCVLTAMAFIPNKQTIGVNITGNAVLVAGNACLFYAGTNGRIYAEWNP